MRRVLFSVGHSAHPIGAFLDLLTGAQIDEVVDVRSMPYSRRHPQFSREALVGHLRAQGIGYAFLGRELGARSLDPDCWEDGRVSFARLAQSSLFQQGLARVRELASRRRVALLCAEREPLDCHRSILVCRALRAAELEIQHILADGALQSHSDLEQRLLTRSGAQAELFGAAAALEAAYERAGLRIAFRGPGPGAVSPRE